MTLNEYLLSLPDSQRKSFAEAAGTTVGYLQLLAYGVRKSSAALAINIERESGGMVRCETLCPGVDWVYIRGSR